MLLTHGGVFDLCGSNLYSPVPFISSVITIAAAQIRWFIWVIFRSFPSSISSIALFAVCIIVFILNIFWNFCNLVLLSVSICVTWQYVFSTFSFNLWIWFLCCWISVSSSFVDAASGFCSPSRMVIIIIIINYYVTFYGGKPFVCVNA